MNVDAVDWAIIAVFVITGPALMFWCARKVGESWRKDVYTREKLRLYLVMTVAGALAGWLVSLVKPLLGVVLVWALYTPPPVPIVAVPFAVIFVLALPFTILSRIMLWAWEPFYWRTVSPRMSKRLRIEYGLDPDGPERRRA